MQRLPVDGRGFRQFRDGGRLMPAAPAPSVSTSSSRRYGSARDSAASMSARSRGFASRAARRTQPQERSGLVEHGRFRFFRLLGGERGDESLASRGIALRNRGAERPFVDFGRREELVRAARRARATAPVRWTTARSGASGQRNSRRARRTRRSHSRSVAGSRSPVSSTAPGPSKNRLWPVRRRESAKGAASGSLSRMLPVRSGCRVRRGSGPRARAAPTRSAIRPRARRRGSGAARAPAPARLRAGNR